MIRPVIPTWSWFPGMKMAGHCQDCSSIIATFRSSTGRAPLECQKSPRKIIPAFLHPRRFLRSAWYSEQARECSPFSGKTELFRKVAQHVCYLWAMLKNKLWNRFRNKRYKNITMSITKYCSPQTFMVFWFANAIGEKVLKSHLASATACTVWSTWRQMSHVRRLKCRSEKTTHDSGSAQMSFFWVHNHQKKTLTLCAWMLAVEVKKCSSSYESTVFIPALFFEFYFNFAFSVFSAHQSFTILSPWRFCDYVGNADVYRFNRVRSLNFHVPHISVAFNFQAHVHHNSLCPHPSPFYKAIRLTGFRV